ncbi:MAG: glycosyltransferase [Thermogemmatispora sp.]|uniref:glycosyltransferase n=1 Tax=Thermogemmatispora sp. TaxID=1968838 RepID=UPI002632117C|nr:glycosyltransferase [Thermogemmatispora sp.]MBX5457343.1 glycosyltransferase [Thermogemmatispora sp.]
MHKQVGGNERGKGRSPQLSVILCTYNRCNLVLSALASLRRQTLARHLYEVIVVDNGSRDGTPAVLQRYLQARAPDERDWQVRCLIERRNGLAYARNAALQVARGEIAVFLDDDALASPRFLEYLLQAYVETGADAVGGRVELYWEAPRPYWLTDELLPVLGYFAPAGERQQLKAPQSLGSCCFSVKVAALRAVGGFSPLLDKRLAVPTRLGVEDLCRRLHAAGYALWYEPRALVAHRAHAARLCRTFFIGHAYWQGRSEVLMELSAALAQRAEERNACLSWRALLTDLRHLARLWLWEQPHLLIARGTSAQHLYLTMESVRCWGRFQQRLSLLWRPLPQEGSLAVLLVMAPQCEAATLLLAQALRREGLACQVERANLSLTWLWRHRGLDGQACGIVQLQRPGAWCLPLRRGLNLLLRLWLARRLGLPLVVADSGGWWHSARGFRPLLRRWLERYLLRQAQAILVPTQRIEDFYPERSLQKRTQSLPPAGFRGYYAAPLPRVEAYRRLGIPASVPYVYLCFASWHSEEEVLSLCESFRRLWEKLMPVPGDVSQGPHLLLVGTPADRPRPTRLLRLAARMHMLHLFLRPPLDEDIPLYLGAADAVVLPQRSHLRAGNVELALLALSYGRAVVAPALPSFADLPASQAVVFYHAADEADLERALGEVRSSLVQDLLRTACAEPRLEAVAGWRDYARHLVKLYEGFRW